MNKVGPVSNTSRVILSSSIFVTLPKTLLLRDSMKNGRIPFFHTVSLKALFELAPGLRLQVLTLPAALWEIHRCAQKLHHTVPLIFSGALPR
jgi:hypothetical protein